MTREQMTACVDSLKNADLSGLVVKLEPGMPVPPDVVVLTDGEGLGTGPLVGGIAVDGYKISHTAFGYPDLSRLTTKKIPHKDMILDDLASSCACCGQPLTDGLSCQRGMGPSCSRKGYSEDPVDGDEMDAFICLSEFQELVEFLTEHYKPLGIRGLVNGLVRVASLNRPRGQGKNAEGNEKLFKACCDAVEALGYVKMAEVLRNSLVVAWLNKSEEPGEDGISYLRTKAYRTPDWLYGEIRSSVGGVDWDRKARTFRIPMHKVGQPGSLVVSKDPHKSNKRVVWEALLKAFEGYVVKIDGRAVPIRVQKA